MPRARPKHWLLSLAVLFVTVLWEVAWSSPLDRGLTGPGPMTGVTEAHPMAVFINPAAFSEAPDGWHLHLESRLGLSHGSMDRQIVDGQGNTLGSESTELLTLDPTASVLAYFVGERFSIAFGLDMPTTEHWDNSRASRYHAQGGYLRRFSVPHLAVNLKIGGRVAIGASISYRIASARLRFARDTALEQGSPGLNSTCGASACGVENPLATEFYDINARSSFLSIGNLQFGFGGILRITRGTGYRWWMFAFGYSGESASPLSLKGDVDVTLAPRDGGGTVSGSSEVLFVMPQEINTGVRGPLTADFDIYAHFRWSLLDVHQSIDQRFFGADLRNAGIPERITRYRGFNDVFSAQVGIELSETLTWEYQREDETRRLTRERPFRWGVGVGGSLGAVPSHQISPGRIEPWHLSASTAIAWRFHPQWLLEAGYSFVYFRTQNVNDGPFSPQERVECVESDYTFDLCEAVRQGRGIPSANGSYSRIGHDMRVGVRVNF